MQIPPDAFAKPVLRKFAPHPGDYFLAKCAPARDSARLRQILRDLPGIRLPLNWKGGRCGKARAALPPTDTAQPSACPNRDSIRAAGNPLRANALSRVPANIPG